MFSCSTHSDTPDNPYFEVCDNNGEAFRVQTERYGIGMSAFSFKCLRSLLRGLMCIFRWHLLRRKGLLNFIEMSVHRNTSKSLKVVREMFA